MRVITCPKAALGLQLGRVDLFKGVSDATIALLVRSAVLMEFDRQEAIFVERAPSAYCFALVSGNAKVVHRLDDGRERLVRLVKPGGTIGEAVMFRQSTYPATAVAQDECRVIRIPRDSFAEAVRSDMAMALSLIGALSVRVRMFTNKVGIQGSRVSIRLASYILHRAKFAGSDTFDLGMSREEMANMMGIVRETLSRSLSRLVSDQIIAVSGRTITILDRKRIETLCGEMEPRRRPLSSK